MMQAFFEKIILGKSAIKEYLVLFCISLSCTDGKSSSDAGRSPILMALGMTCFYTQVMHPVHRSFGVCNLGSQPIINMHI